MKRSDCLRYTTRAKARNGRHAASSDTGVREHCKITVEGQDVLEAELLEVETAEQSLKARLGMKVRPNRVDLEINQSRFGPPVAILECIERHRISAERGIRLR